MTAVFGGSFDPPHCAHVLVVAYLLTCTEVSEVFVIPCAQHAFGKVLAPFWDRMAMCRAAFRVFGRRVRVLDLEARLPVPSYTVQTLRHLVAAHPDRSFTLVIGSDIVAELDRWHEVGEIRRLARILVLAREGTAPAGTRGPVFPAISSSAIRAALADGRDVSDLVPAAVLDWIHRKHLYSTR